MSKFAPSNTKLLQNAMAERIKLPPRLVGAFQARIERRGVSCRILEQSVVGKAIFGHVAIGRAVLRRDIDVEGTSTMVYQKTRRRVDEAEPLPKHGRDQDAYKCKINVWFAIGPQGLGCRSDLLKCNTSWRSQWKLMCDGLRRHNSRDLSRLVGAVQRR
jgi:hypothetical protein